MTSFLIMPPSLKKITRIIPDKSYEGTENFKLIAAVVQKLSQGLPGRGPKSQFCF